MRIVGASFDKPEKLAAWAENQSYAFELWSDADHTLARHFGAEGAMSPRRITRLLDDQGRVLLTYDSVSVGTHPADVLEDCKKLFETSDETSRGASAGQ